MSRAPAAEQGAPKTRHRAALGVLTAGVLAACAAPRVAWEEYAPAGDRDADVLHLVRTLQERHPDLYSVHPPEDWVAEVEALRARLSGLDEDGFRLGLMRLTALAGDSHTKLARSRALEKDRLPLALRWFEDGLHVWAADASQRELIGAELLAVDGLPVAKALARIGEVVPHENEDVLRLFGTEHLTHARVLAGIGVTRRAERAELRLRLAGKDAPRTDTLEARSGRRVHWTRHADPGRKTPRPAWTRRRRDPYWSGSLAGGRVLYLRFAHCREDPGHPFAAYFAEFIAPAEQAPPVAVIVDLRRNGGGNSRVLMPLVRWFQERGDRAPPLYGLVDAGTYSSAFLNAFHLRTLTAAVLVGETPAQPLDSFGEVRKFALPGSGIQVQHSTRRFHLSGSGAGSGRLRPDREIATTSADWFAGRDPVLAWAVEDALRRLDADAP